MTVFMYSECRYEDSNKPGYQSADMPRVQRKRIPPGPWYLIFLFYQMTHSVYLPAFKKVTMSLLSAASDGLLYALISGMYPELMYLRLGSASPNQHSPIETVRTFFPETWIWELIEVG